MPPTSGLRWPHYLISILVAAGVWKSATGLYSIARSFSSGDWAAATTPGLATYHPLWKPLLIGEATLDVLLLILGPFVLLSLARRARHFPFMASLFFALNAMGQAIEVYYLPDMVSTGRFQNGAGQGPLVAAIVELIAVAAYVLLTRAGAAPFEASPDVVQTGR